MTSGPFGKYATIIAALVCVGVLATWLATLTGFAPPSPQLDAIALVIVGAIFGTGAGATVVANGIGKQADAANTRLDAMHASSSATATKLIEHDTTEWNGNG